MGKLFYFSPLLTRQADERRKDVAGTQSLERQERMENAGERLAYVCVKVQCFVETVPPKRRAETLSRAVSPQGKFMNIRVSRLVGRQK